MRTCDECGEVLAKYEYMSCTECIDDYVDEEIYNEDE